MEHWRLQEAKARMLELVKRAQVAPQGITLRSKPVAMMVSRASFDTPSQAKGSLLEYMLASPLAKLPGSDEPAFERERGRTRRVPRL